MTLNTPATPPEHLSPSVDASTASPLQKSHRIRRIVLWVLSVLVAAFLGLVALGLLLGEPSQNAQNAGGGEPALTPPTVPGARVSVVPAQVLRSAIATTGLGAAYKVERVEVQDKAHMLAGLDLSDYGKFVSGPAACASLFQPHSVTTPSYALVVMKAPSGSLDVVTESYESIAQAKKVMAENEKQAKGCTTFKMSLGDSKEMATATYGYVGASGGKNDTEFAITTLRGQTATYRFAIESVEFRMGGEILHVRSEPAFGKTPYAKVEAHFKDVITTYRTAHPRPGAD